MQELLSYSAGAGWPVRHHRAARIIGLRASQGCASQGCAHHRAARISWQVALQAYSLKAVEPHQLYEDC